MKRRTIESMTVVNTAQAARSLRNDVAASLATQMSDSFDAIHVMTLRDNLADTARETRVFLVGGQRVTITLTVEPLSNG